LTWGECVAEAMIGCEDAGVRPPPLVASEFAALTEASTPHSVRVCGYESRLRLVARRNPHAALLLLDEADGEVGCSQVERGLEAVLGRLALIDRGAPERYVSDRRDRLVDAILGFRARLTLIAGPSDGPCLDVLIAQLEQAISQDQISRRDAWTAAFELLWAAARLGTAAAAERIIRATGPPGWSILNATWVPSRRRGLAGNVEPTGFLDRIAGAMEWADSGAASHDPPPAPDWNELPRAMAEDYWRLRALPIGGLPWWTPWGAGLP
jgi:hypothetical protein